VELGENEGGDGVVLVLKLCKSGGEMREWSGRSKKDCCNIDWQLTREV
jgi:hypothetical protein